MHNRVFVLDSHKQPLMPCHPARARKLMRQGRAAVFQRFPFTIILLERSGGVTQPVQTKLDPGSRVSGIALVADFKRGKRCIWAAELTHRGAHRYCRLIQRTDGYAYTQRKDGVSSRA